MSFASGSASLSSSRAAAHRASQVTLPPPIAPNDASRSVVFAILFSGQKNVASKPARSDSSAAYLMSWSLTGTPSAAQASGAFGETLAP